jgi:hypothetical protein
VARAIQWIRSADLTFGAGKRVCLGKNISILETYKVIPSFFLAFDVSISSSPPVNETDGGRNKGIYAEYEVADGFCGSREGMAYSEFAVHEIVWDRRQNPKKSICDSLNWQSYFLRSEAFKLFP